MTWRYFGLWKQYTPDWNDPINPTTYLRNEQGLDWYDLAHGHYGAAGHYVPHGGYWLSVHPETRRVDKLRAGAELQFTAPAGAPETGMELWWTDETPPEFPYTGINGNLYLHIGGAPEEGVLPHGLSFDPLGTAK